MSATNLKATRVLCFPTAHFPLASVSEEIAEDIVFGFDQARAQATTSKRSLLFPAIAARGAGPRA